MTQLPEDFDGWEHLQSTTMQVHNKLVREEFSDVGDDNWSADITTPRGSLRVACTMLDSDSDSMINQRFFLFYVMLRKASDLQPAIYGIPTTTFQEQMRFFPQIRLFFSEDLNEVEHGYTPLEAIITYRLVHETSASMTPTKAKAIAQRINTLFCSAGGFRWKKGRERWAYKDTEHGFDLRALAYNETEAKKLFGQIIEIGEASPNWSRYLDGTEKKRDFQTVPGQHLIYGKERKAFRDRPVGYVRFRYAELKLHGLTNDIQLIDRTGTRRNPLIHAH